MSPLSNSNHQQHQQQQGWYPPHPHMMHGYLHGMHPEGYDIMGGGGSMHHNSTMDHHPQSASSDDDSPSSSNDHNTMHYHHGHHQHRDYPYHYYQHWGQPYDHDRHQQQQAQATPRQPPPHLYNGPPVSALVPRDRAPRNAAAAHHQQQQQHNMHQHYYQMHHQQHHAHGYTPYEMDTSNRRISFPHPPPFPYQQPPGTSGSNSSKDSSSSDRRSSFGSVPGSLSNYSNFYSTPYHSSSNNFPVLGDSSPEDGIPPPPPLSTEVKVAPPPPPNDNNESSSAAAALEEVQQQGTPEVVNEEAPLRDSRRQNLLSTKFEGEANGNEKLQETSTTTTTTAPVDGAKYQQEKNQLEPAASTTTTTTFFSKEKSSVVDHASLLLTLSTKSPANSPANMEEPPKKNKTIVTDIAMKQPPADKPKAAPAAAKPAPLVKSCFPAKVPATYPTRLALPNDSIKLNSLHCFVREELLEIFVVDAANRDLQFRHAPSSSVGRVGLRCVHCAQARKICSNLDDEAPMAVFYPKSVGEIYRLVTSWQRCHVRKCRSLPPSIRARWEELRRTDKSRGKTAYWASSARLIGMVDCPSRAGGIRFAVPDDSDDDDEEECEEEKPTAADNTENEHVSEQTNANNPDNKDSGSATTPSSKAGNALQASATANIDAA